jgi:methylmalonyl-CoA mutase
LSSKGSPTILPDEVIRATTEEKEYQIKTLERLHDRANQDELFEKLQKKAMANENIFEELMEVAKHCSLGQITHALFAVGGQYRRNM